MNTSNNVIWACVFEFWICFGFRNWKLGFFRRLSFMLGSKLSGVKFLLWGRKFAFASTKQASLEVIGGSVFWSRGVWRWLGFDKCFHPSTSNIIQLWSKIYLLFFSWASLWRNKLTSESTIEAITAVIKFSIVNPGTTKLTPHKSTTLIRNAVIPKVIMERGIKIICKTGFINVLTTPITTAVTIVSQNVSNVKPGTKYETISKVNIFKAKVIINFIRCRYLKWLNG